MQELQTKDYLAQKFRAPRWLTGNTPLLGIHFRFHGREGRVCAKSEREHFSANVLFARLFDPEGAERLDSRGVSASKQPPSCKRMC